MRIINSEYTRYPLMLAEVAPGDVVEFEWGFHQKHEHDAKFLVLRVPAEHIRADKRNKDRQWRIMVANLETGNVSLVTTERKVRKFTAEVRLS